MKKLIPIVLVLLLLMPLAAHAAAFTGDTRNTVSTEAYKLHIFLVEYEDKGMLTEASLPETDRGYAKNEIVAAVVELYVPEDDEIKGQDYGKLVFGGENISLNVADNRDTAGNIDMEINDAVSDDANITTFSSLIDDEIVTRINSLPGENTYKWLFFAKVTDDDASLYAKLIDGSGNDGFGQDDVMEVTLEGTQYLIWKTTPNSDGDFSYIIAVIDSGSDYYKSEIRIDVDDAHKSLGMRIDIDGGQGTAYVPAALGVNTAGKLGVIDPSNPAKVLTDGSLYDDIMDIYDDIVEGVFGMDYYFIGNYVRDSFFEDLVSANTIVSTVDIQPYAAYVIVPDTVVVNPPKTGDAASILGFSMIALAGAGVILLRKRG